RFSMTDQVQMGHEAIPLVRRSGHPGGQYTKKRPPRLEPERSSEVEEGSREELAAGIRTGGLRAERERQGVLQSRWRDRLEAGQASGGDDDITHFTGQTGGLRWRCAGGYATDGGKREGCTSEGDCE